MSKGTVLFNRKDKSLNEEIWDDTALIRMYEKSIEKTYDKIRRSGSNASLSDSKDVKAKSETNSKRRESMNSSKSSTVADWKVGDLCMAPYDDKWYPATILSIDEKSKKCKVIYNGYDEEGTVDIKDLLKNEEVIPCKRIKIADEACQIYIENVKIDKQISSDADNLKEKSIKYGPHCNTSDVSTIISMKTQSLNSAPLKNINKNAKINQIFPHIGPQLSTNATTSTSNESKISNRAISKLYKKMQHKVSRKIRSKNFASTKEYIAEVQQRLKESNLFEILREEDVEWDEDEPESALEDSAMDESQSSHTEDTTDNEKVIKKPREVPTDATNSAGTSETMPIPDLVPPPPPALFGKIVGASTEKEALTNMLMSWYMTGYHTGDARRQREENRNKSTRKEEMTL